MNLVGQTESDARGILVAQGLVLGKRSERPVEKEVGRVIEQEPKAGTVVRRGDVVSIVVGSSNLILGPNLIGLTPEEARELLKENDLKLGQVSTVSVRADQAGLVVNQDPPPNSRVPRGNSVAVVVGDTAEVTVPNLIGRIEQDAKAVLKMAGLRLEEVETTPVSTDKAGLVLDQAPEAGSRVSPKAAVSITVGLKDEVTVPNVIGRPEENGIKILREVGLTVGEVCTIPVSDEKVGTIIDQNPVAGSQDLRGSTVSLEVGRRDEVTVPSVIGRTEDEALKILNRAGLKLGTLVTTPAAPNQVGRVVRQDPGAGDKEGRGTPVSLVMGVAQLVVVPNVVAKKLTEASKMLQKANLKVGKITRVPATAAKVGQVLSQNPKSGQRMAPGTSVALQIGIRKELELNVVTSRAEKNVRAKGVGLDENQGYLAKKLEAAGITTTPELESFLKQKPQVIRDRLKLRNLKITSQTVSALKAAFKSG